MQNGKLGAYSGLIFVIFIWGIAPLVTLYFYDFFSPTIRIALGAAVSGLAMLLISVRHLGLLNRSYFKIAIPTGACVAIANILQKIGLQYTTPTNYAFLENLSVVVVPILIFLLCRKKPSALTVTATVLCLASSLVLTGMLQGSSMHLTGDLLCALAGVLYGVNIAVTGTYAKQFFVPLYLMIQIFLEAAVSFITALVLHTTGIEPILFTLDARPILLNVGFVLISSTMGWLIRTAAMKKISPTVVAVMMPFSSAVTMIASVLSGKDTLSAALIIGVVIGLVAIILSGLGDRPEKEVKKQA